jgi:hypothetical protein
MKAILAICLAGLLAPATLPAQRVDISPRLGLGVGSPRVGLRSTFITAEAGVRLDVAMGEWGGYGRYGTQVVSQTCATSLPPYCNFPRGSARDLAIGVSRFFTNDGPWWSYLSAGAGVLSWDGDDAFFDAEGGLRRAIGRGSFLTLGLHALISSSVERPRNGDRPIVQDHILILANPFVGLGFGVGSR